MTPFERWFRRYFGYNNHQFFWPLFGGVLILHFVATFTRYPATFTG